MLQEKLKKQSLQELKQSQLQKHKTDRIGQTHDPNADINPLYHSTGVFQRVATNPHFENGTLGVIVLNAIWLAVDADYNNEELLINAHVIFQVMEHFFCIFFFLEVSVRFMSFRRKQTCCTDAWFVFDSALVFLMVLETWLITLVMAVMNSTAGLGSASVMRLIRLLRLARMARVMRLLRALPELLILIKGMASAARSVAYALCLLVLLLYIFGIIFVQLSAGSELQAKYFNSVPRAMYVLMIHGAFLDGMGGFLDALGEESLMQQAVFMVFVLFAALMVMNLVIGVLCEVVSAVSASEQEAMRIDNAKDILRAHVSEMDQNADNLITQEEFLHVVDNRDIVNALQEIGVCAITLLEVADEVFADGPLTVECFMDSVLRFRCSKAATLKDIVDLRNHISACTSYSSSPASPTSPAVRLTQVEPWCNGSADHNLDAWVTPGAPITEQDCRVKQQVVLHSRLAESEASPLTSARDLSPSDQASTVRLLQDMNTHLNRLTNVVSGMQTEIRGALGDLNERTGRIESALKARGEL